MYRALFSNLHYKILSLLFAVLLWLLAANKETAEVTVKVHYSPESFGNYKIIDYKPKELKIKVEGYRKDLLRVENLKQISLLLPKELPKNEGWIEVKVKKNSLILPVESVKVKSVRPKTIKIRIEKIVKKVVPIKVNLTGIPPNAVVREEPNYAVVSIPAETAGEISSVETENLDLSNVKLPATVVVKIKSHFKVEPEKVKITVEEGENEGKEEALWNGRNKGNSQ
jgi:YbbR domain-containing protein